MRSTDSLQLFILFLIAGLTPLVFMTKTLDPVMVPRMFLLSSLILALTVLLFPSLGKINEGVGRHLFTRWVFIFAIALVGFIAVSCLKSSLPGESIFELLKTLVPFLLLAPCTLFFCNNPRSVIPVARLISIAALALSIIGLGQFYGLAFLWLPGNIVPYATMANKNLLASYLFLSLPWSFIAFGGEQKFWRIITVLSVSTTMLLIVLSRTRAVWVAVALVALFAMLLLVLMDRKSRQNNSKDRFLTWRTLIGATSWLILFVGLIYIADPSSGRGGSPLDAASVVESPSPSLKTGPKPESLLDRAESVIKARDQSIKDRLIIWSQSLEMIAQNPLMGVGPGQWRVHIAGYGTEGLRSEAGIIHFQRPHNDYLWIAAESGIPALILYIAFLVAGLLYCLRLMFTSPDRQERVQVLLLFLGIVGFMVISFFSYPMERPVHMTYLMLMVGLIVSLYHRRNPISGTKRQKPVLIVWLLTATILVATAVAAYSRIESEKHINLAYSYQERNDWINMIGEIDKGETFLTPMDPTATPLAWYRGIANSALNRNEIAFDDFKKAYQVNSNHLHVLTNLGTVYEMKGDHSSAIIYYKKALKISPGFKDAALNLAAVYYNTGEYHKAYETISAVKHPDNDPRYQLYLDRVKQRMSEDSTSSAKEID